MVVAFIKRQLLKLILRCWAWITARVVVEALTMETARLVPIGGKSGSIWSMKKVELAEVARKELGMTVAQAQKETVITLREKIRRVRAVTNLTEDPLAKAPKGLDRLSLDELKEQVITRDLQMMDKPTRAALNRQIRDDIQTRIQVQNSAAARGSSEGEDSGIPQRNVQ